MAAFDGLEEFVAVAETQGFAAAGRRLHVSTSNVSRKIQQLEARLGVALFARSTRRVRLTESGHSYYQRCRELLAGLEEANESVHSDRSSLSGVLRVSAAGEFAKQYVAPALLRFANGHPELGIEFDFNSRMVNFIEEDFDFSIRYGSLEDSRLIARKLAGRALVAAASPEYLARHGTPQSPSELREHQCVISNNDVWRFDEAGQERTIKVSGRWRSNDALSNLAACEADFGIVYMPRSSFGSSLEQGRLQPVLEPYWAQASTWIVFANRQYLPSRTRLAIDYLLEHFRDWRE